MDIITSLTHKLLLTENRGHCLQVLNDILLRLSVPADIIGGVALANYNYIRNTEDVDIVIRKSDYSKIADAIVRAGGASLGKNNKFELCGFIVQLYYPGLKAGNTTFVDPIATAPGAHPLDLPRLLAMKITANRARDRADFIELIKRNDLGLDYIENNVLPFVAKKIDKKMAIQKWYDAQKEMQE